MKRAMIIDDSEDVHYIIKRYFDREGIEVVSAVNGREALDYLCKEDSRKPDLILLDVNMPIMNGFEFLEEYENKCQCADSPVVMLTSSTLDADKEKAEGYGCVKGYVAKPILKPQIAEILGIAENL